MPTIKPWTNYRNGISGFTPTLGRGIDPELQRAIRRLYDHINANAAYGMKVNDSGLTFNVLDSTWQSGPISTLVFDTSDGLMQQTDSNKAIQVSQDGIYLVAGRAAFSTNVPYHRLLTRVARNSVDIQPGNSLTVAELDIRLVATDGLSTVSFAGGSPTEAVAGDKFSVNWWCDRTTIGVGQDTLLDFLGGWLCVVRLF